MYQELKDFLKDYFTLDPEVLEQGFSTRSSDRTSNKNKQETSTHSLSSKKS